VWRGIDKAMEEIVGPLRNYFKNICPELTENFVTLQNTPLNQLIDSIAMIEFLAFLEDKFKIKIEISEVVSENFKNINTISLYIRKKLI